MNIERVIINADDFGLNKHCTDAICEAFEKGLITDTTLMANGKAFDYAIKRINADGIGERIGIHFNITEGEPLTENIKNLPEFVAAGHFHGRIDRLKPLSRAEKKAVYEELTAQAHKLESNGVHISHADSHHHIHTAIFIAPIVLRVCSEHKINKIRLHRNVGKISKFKYIVKKIYNNYLRRKKFITTQFFGSMDDMESGEIKGSLEIMVHPDFDSAGAIIDRVGEEDGFPIGQPLSGSKLYGQEIDFINYSKL